MKISNETKVGALTAIAIVLLILGFNFLKGKTIFKTGHFIYGEYPDAKGLMVSNPVYINGFNVGSVYEIENTDATLKTIHVSMKLKGSYNIPINSIAGIAGNPLGTPSIEIKLGNATTFLQSGDRINTSSDAGLFGGLTNKIGPVADQLKVTTHTLDSVLRNINSIFDASAKNNLQSVIANMNRTTASLMGSAASIEKMINAQSGSIAQSMNNLNKFTKGLADNSDKITNTLTNLETTASNLSKADIDGSVKNLKAAIDKVNTLIDKAGSKDGSLGLLMTDKALYNNLINTVRSANILLDDIRTHPKRYVSISVFGKKDKGDALTAPLDDTIK
ncbi:MAG: MCE family protein [Chitinophagaceae bacterium]|nr:MCE family protein [Chitinophagaceae bacterium]